MSDNIIKAAGVFFEGIEGILKAYMRHVQGGRKFTGDTLTCLEQLAMCLNFAASQTGTDLNQDLKDAISTFAPKANAEAVPQVEVVESAAKFYENVTAIIRFFYRQELDGKVPTDSCKSLLSQASQCVRKVIISMGTQLDQNDSDDKALGNAMQHYIPKGASVGNLTGASKSEDKS